MTPIRERIRMEDAQRVRVPHPEQPKQAVSAKIFKACKGSPTGVSAAMRGRPNPEAGRTVGNRRRQTRAALQGGFDSLPPDYDTNIARHGKD